MNKMINIATDYTRYPGPRYASDGPFSGEVFRDTILMDALKQAIATGGMVTVSLDGVAGYGSSFLEEAFGGLLRKGFTRDTLDRHLRVIAHTDRFQHHARAAQKYIADAALQAA